MLELRVQGALPKTSELSNELSESVLKSMIYLAAGSLTFARRKFCATKNGYIGWVPPKTKPNDLVFIILGTDTPFILRRCSAGSHEDGSQPPVYRLVGECYLHGMMDGEMLSPDEEVESLSLR